MIAKISEAKHYRHKCMKKGIKMLWIGIGALVIAGGVLWGPIMSDVEQARYNVVEQYGPIEIRDYEPQIVAQAEVSGERDAAINQGFRLIADYIFGNNISSQKVAMTAPVTQQASQKIAMTAPVTQQQDEKGWTVHFIMPAAYTMQTLPKPASDRVSLHELPAKRYAVIRFSGIASAEHLEQQQQKLETFMGQQNLTPLAKPVYAFFNPPWTLPLLRRNEVMIEITKPQTQ